MGFTSIPHCENTDHARSQIPHSSFPSKSVRFDESPATCYSVLSDVTSSDFSGLNNNEFLLRTVMERITDMANDDKHDPLAGLKEYSVEIPQQCRDLSENVVVKSPSPQRVTRDCSGGKVRSSSPVNARNILKRVNVKKRQKKEKNDVNNNFIVLTKERLKIPNWREQNVYNRLDVLAQPKPLPDGYEEEKEPTYWISKKPPPVPKAGFTTSVASARVEELAKSMYNIKGEFIGNSHCHWYDESMRVKRGHKDPDCVDWDRLATPKKRYAEAFRNPRQPVKGSALKYEATKRLHQLAVPKKKIDCGAYYLWLWNKKPDVNEKLHRIRQLSIDKTDMEDARILLRCDLDFTEGKKIERKIKDILPTIEYAFKKKARSVIIISHCGDPNGKVVPDLSLESLMGRLAEALPENHVVFLDNCIGAEAKALCEDPEVGHVFLLENLRFHPEELGYYLKDDGSKVMCTKEAVEKFHKILSSFGDVYVNDAFSILHQDPITNFGDPKKERCYGLHIKQALKIYNYFIVNNQQKRLVAVIGGFYDDVADIISSLMGKAAEILLGGEIALMFLHTVKGVDVGETECSPYHQKKIKDMMTRARDTGTIINLPADVVVENINCPGIYYTGHSKDHIDDFYKAVDIGPLTRDCYQSIMLTADNLIWHGRMGELNDGTSSIANSFGLAREDYGIETYLVDNDTISYFNKFCKKGKASHITEKSEVTMTFLHKKIPKSITSLSPWRRKVKKRPPKEVQVSTKPVSYETPCMKMCNAMDRRSIDELELKDKKVLIRCDFNVPMVHGEVKDLFRIRMAVPSIAYALQCGAHAVILISSIGYMCGKRVESQSLKGPSLHLAKYLHITEKAVVFVAEPTLAKVQAALKNCYPGTVIVVENINFREEELAFRADVSTQTLKDTQKVANFCEEVSCMGDVYVNDSFDNLHTPSTSTCGIMVKDRACGFLLKNELRYLSTIFNAPQRPILVIVGGLYSKAKTDALKALLREIDEVIITGRMALTFLRVINKMPTGASVILPELEAEVPAIVDLAATNKVRIHYPVDFLVASDISDSSNIKQSSASVGMPAGWYAVDIGDNSCSLFKQVVKRSKLIFWHGVAGIVEFERFRKGTQTLLNVITMVTKDPEYGVISIVGGNSILSFTHSFNPEFQGVSHMTTGGLSCSALIKDRCLTPIGLLSAGRERQNLNKLAVKDLDITGMSVLLRANMNAPRSPDGKTITDLTCVRSLLPTITSLQKRGARCITVVGSYGSPDGKKVEEFSLLPFKIELEKRLRQEIVFFETGVSGASIVGASGGKVQMLENLLFHPEEKGWEETSYGERVKMEYSAIDDYRRQMSSLGELFVNDSLNSLSDCDSSVVGVTIKTRCSGFVLKNEITKFSKFLEKMTTPMLVIIGGYSGTSIVTRKLEMLFDLLDQVTDVMLCSDLAYSYIRVVMPQAKMENTPYDEELAKLWPRVISKAKLNNIKFHVPVDFCINDKVEVEPEEASEIQQLPTASAQLSEPTEDDAGEPRLVPVVRTVQEGMGADFMAMDIGPATLNNYLEIINNVGSIVLMGPMGEFEEKDYDEGSKAILDAIKEAGSQNGTPAIAFCQDTYRMLETLEKVDAVSHCSLAGRSCVNLLRNVLLPGLEHLDLPKPKPLKKLSVDRFNISGKRVMLRLDLNVPIVSGVVLDISKIQTSLPTIQYLLEKGAKCVILLGHRGRPHGYKNSYLSLEPMAAEFARLLNMTVNFLPYPCSSKVRGILEDPKPGSIFLMENLKFYPAEEGRDIIRKKIAPVKEESPEEGAPEDAVEGDGATPSVEIKEEEKEEVAELNVVLEEGEEPKETEEPAEEKEGMAEGGEEIEYYDEDEEGNEGEENDEFITFTDSEDLDRYMYEKMAPKSLQKYIEELSECGDIFVTDDVIDMNSNLTSMTKLNLPKKMCGLLVKDFLSKSDSDDIYKYKSIAPLSPAPKEGETDDLVL